MTTTSAGSVTIAGTAVLQSPRAIDPQKGPRNVVFDANLCIVEGSLTVTMALLRYFAPNDMANEIQKIATKKYQKAFIIASVNIHHCLSTTFRLTFIYVDHHRPSR